MVEDHLFRIGYKLNSRLITTVNLSRREAIEFVAGVGGQRVVNIYEGESLADPETVSGMLEAAQKYSE
jgi:hypothetical protein